MKIVVLLALCLSASLAPLCVVAQDQLPGITDSLVVDTPPKPLNMGKVVKMISYPEEARKNAESGLFVARVLVDEKGKYLKHVLLTGEGEHLKNAINEYIPYLQFEPAKRNMQPVKFWVNIPFEFKPAN